MTAPTGGSSQPSGERRRIVRNLVTRSDGKLVNVAWKRGQLFVCGLGCCCGDTVHGAAPVPMELFHSEWERRKLRPHVHLSIGGCLGPCVLANVVMLLFDGRSIWFHSFNDECMVIALYDYIEAMVAAQAYLPPPASLADFHFDAFNWDAEPAHRTPTAGIAAAQPTSTAASDISLPATAMGSGGFVFLTHADTDLLTLAHARDALGPEFPPIRGYNIGHLKNEDDAAAFVDGAVAGAEVVMLRLLGGRGSFRGGFERAIARAEADDQWLICLPGTDALDPELTAASNVGAPVAHEVLAYLQLGGIKNVEHMLRFLADHLLATGFAYDAPEPQPRHGVYYQTPTTRQATLTTDRTKATTGRNSVPGATDNPEGVASYSVEPTTKPEEEWPPAFPLAPTGGEDWGEMEPPTVGLLFYRSHLLSGNTAFVDAIIRDIERRGARAIAVFTSSLQDVERQEPASTVPASIEQHQPADPARASAEQEDAGNDGADEARQHGAASSPPLRSSASSPPGCRAVGNNAGEAQESLLSPPELSTRNQSLIDEAQLPTALRFFLADGQPRIDVLVTTTSFAAASGADDGYADPFVRLGIPVVQAIAASTRQKQWQESLRGLSAIDTAMNVAIPELDGRIIAPPVCFKSAVPLRVGLKSEARGAQLYEPYPHGIARTIGISLKIAALHRKSNGEKRIAIILTNANTKASRIGAAVGLDTPASVIRILHAMGEAGYDVGEIPESGDALLHALIDRGSYDREVLTSAQLATMPVHVATDVETRWMGEIPEMRRVEMEQRWGPPPGKHYVDGRGRLALAGLTFGNIFVAIQPPRGYDMEPSLIYHAPDLPPPYPYHALYRWLAEPQMLGGWETDAMIQVGKHGTLEWLPGKSIGLSEECFPDLFLGDIPLIYPFIINNPGEGAQAKRRAHAVVVDHLTPPMTTAEGYGEVEELSRLVDEYYQLEQLDPSKLPLLQQQIWELIKQARLDADLSQLMNRDSTGSHTHPWDPQAHEDGVPYTISDMGARDFAHLIENVNGYLCELTSAEIRDGLHTLGVAPRDAQLIDTLLSLVRLPNLDIPSLRAGVADWFGLDLAAILDHLETRVASSTSSTSTLNTAASPPAIAPSGSSEPISTQKPRDHREFPLSPTDESTPSPQPSTRGRGGFPEDSLQGDGLSTPSPSENGSDDNWSGWSPIEHLAGRALPTNADILEAIDLLGRRLLADLADRSFATSAIPTAIRSVLGDPGDPMDAAALPELERSLTFVCQALVPNLHRTDEEITNLLHALDGEHIAAGPSGAPTRGMAQVLPTGRNFYTVDPRGLPSLAAWTVGEQLADGLLRRHYEDEGRYPESVGISIWGTSLMRTHGDDVAEVMALIGVRPKWQAESRRLIGFDVIPLRELGRPRVDVICRVSGFFRDAFRDLIALLDNAFHTVAELDEPIEENAVRRHFLDRKLQLEAEGLAESEAAHRSLFRIFGSPPGAYGAGILELIDARNWETDADLAEVYVNWGGYAYTADDFGVDARQDFRWSLAHVDAAVKNQDNREHDIFDSDDYFQYHGGMIAAIRALGGRNPRRYFGDSADPARARVRDLKEESMRVFRTRVVNPKWIDSMQRHGYKGALEMAATVDYLFGYDATANVVDDWMYERVTQAYALDPEVQAFFGKSNPWALRDLTSRLMEAMDRGLWENPSPEMRTALQSAYLAAESEIESHAAIGR